MNRLKQLLFLTALVLLFLTCDGAAISLKGYTLLRANNAPQDSEIQRIAIAVIEITGFGGEHSLNSTGEFNIFEVPIPDSLRGVTINILQKDIEALSGWSVEIKITPADPLFKNVTPHYMTYIPQNPSDVYDGGTVFVELSGTLQGEIYYDFAIIRVSTKAGTYVDPPEYTPVTYSVGSPTLSIVADALSFTGSSHPTVNPLLPFTSPSEATHIPFLENEFKSKATTSPILPQLQNFRDSWEGRILPFAFSATGNAQDITVTPTDIALEESDLTDGFTATLTMEATGYLPTPVKLHIPDPTIERAVTEITFEGTSVRKQGINQFNITVDSIQRIIDLIDDGTFDTKIEITKMTGDNPEEFAQRVLINSDESEYDTERTIYDSYKVTVPIQARHFYIIPAKDNPSLNLYFSEN